MYLALCATQAISGRRKLHHYEYMGARHHTCLHCSNFIHYSWHMKCISDGGVAAGKLHNRRPAQFSLVSRAVSGVLEAILDSTFRCEKREAFGASGANASLRKSCVSSRTMAVWLPQNSEMGDCCGACIRCCEGVLTLLQHREGNKVLPGMQPNRDIGSPDHQISAASTARWSAERPQAMLSYSFRGLNLVV